MNVDVNVFPDEESDGPFFVRPVAPKGWYFVYLTGVDAEGLPIHTPRIGVFENFIKAENAARPITYFRSALDLNLLKAQFRNNYGFWTVHA